MARVYKCKCFITGEESTTDVFIKKPVGKQFKYFKSEEIYQQYLKDKEQRSQLYLNVANILNYKILPPFLIKSLNELMIIYNVEVIIETFKKNEDNIHYWLNQDNKFKNDNGKINYMMAIIRNNINEVDRQWQAEQKRKQPNKVNIDIDMMDTEFENKSTNKDISQFL